MKLNNLLVALGATAVSSTLVTRDLQTIQGVVTQVSDQVGNLQKAVDSFSGDAGPLTSANTQLLSILKDGTSKIQATSELSQTDALGLTQPVQSLASAVDGVVNGLISKKDAIVSAGQGGTVLDALQQQKTASDALAAAITSKVPQELQSIAAQLSGTIATSLDKGIAAFQGTGGSGGGSTPPPSGGSSTSGSGSSPTGGSGGSGGTTAKPTVSGSHGGGSHTTASTPAEFTGAAIANAPHFAALGVAVLGLVL